MIRLTRERCLLHPDSRVLFMRSEYVKQNFSEILDCFVKNLYVS